jgi:hypothetical protein
LTKRPIALNYALCDSPEIGKFVAILARTKSGACDDNANPVTRQQVVDGTGTVRIS